MFVCDQVFKHGRIPVAWADMIIGNGRLDLIRNIDKRVVLIPWWDYSSIGKTSKFVIYKGFRPSKKQFYNRYTDPDPILDFPDSGKFFEDLGSKEIKNIGMDEESGYPVSFAQVRLLAKTKRPLWAASGLYMSADMQLHANFVRGVLNPLGMCDTLI
ncbi:MAG: hypothetical protein NC937_05295 [Candidatus Omnitrophica bacterium]|nr:hypothetical protein [Candidatus Omnitrophota bacterium]MCM8825536.1 hypothetical protein [Candidatus Omnitrophota bacterium]